MIKCSICKNKNVSYFHKIKNFKYYLCLNCQTLFLYPQPSSKRIKTYYEKNFNYQSGFINKKRIINQAKKIIRNLKCLNPKGKNLLDIGSGLGYFLKESIKHNLNPIGIEPSKKLSQFIPINRLIGIFQGEFEQYYERNKDKKFDFIVLSHLIEHIKKPRQTIIKITRLLDQNGILYIETPNLNSHLFKVEQENYTFLTPPEHLWIFSLTSFQRIITNLSLKIIKSSTYSYPEHFMGIFKKQFNIYENKNHQDNKNFFNFYKPQKLASLRCFKTSKWIKYLIFDKVLAPLITPFLNCGVYGSILELYIRKKTHNCSV